MARGLDLELGEARPLPPGGGEAAPRQRGKRRGRGLCQKLGTRPMPWGTTDTLCWPQRTGLALQGPSVPWRLRKPCPVLRDPPRHSRPGARRGGACQGSGCAEGPPGSCGSSPTGLGRADRSPLLLTLSLLASTAGSPCSTLVSKHLHTVGWPGVTAHPLASPGQGPDNSTGASVPSAP